MMEWIRTKNQVKLSILLIILKVVFLNIIMKFFIKSIYNIDIKKSITQSLIFISKLFSTLYIIVEEAQYTKVEVET